MSILQTPPPSPLYFLYFVRDDLSLSVSPENSVIPCPLPIPDDKYLKIADWPEMKNEAYFWNYKIYIKKLND